VKQFVRTDLVVLGGFSVAIGLSDSTVRSG
jgi:hypothetical protein